MAPVSRLGGRFCGALKSPATCALCHLPFHFSDQTNEWVGHCCLRPKLQCSTTGHYLCFRLLQNSTTPLFFSLPFPPLFF
uniref:Uncharacterized protein n=1 Tax=Zea mays TaxID=4577 RepID=B6SRE2_MAIZE|nr:hypothetical protein [Zea mays]